MLKQIIVSVTAVLLGVALHATAAPVVLVDGNASLSIEPTTSQGAFDFRIDGLQQLKQNWFWYRTDSFAPEIPINFLLYNGSTQTDLNSVDLRYTLPDTFNLTVSYILTGTASGQGNFGTTANLKVNVVVDNVSGSPLEFHFFTYFDFDLNTVAEDDTATHANTNVWFQTAPNLPVGLQATTAGVGGGAQFPTHWEFGAVPSVLNKLNDFSATTLADAQPTIGPANVAVAFQWDQVIGAINGSAQFNWDFNLTVPCVNASPTLDPLTNMVLIANAGPQTVPLSGISSGATNETQFLAVTAESDNPSIITNLAVNYTNPDTNGFLTFTPVTNAAGVATIRVIVDDQGCDNNRVTNEFTVDINAVDLPPVVSAIGPLVLHHQTGLFEQTVRVTNPSSIPRPAVQLTTTNPLPAGVVLWNASGVSNGIPFVQHNVDLAPNAFVDLQLEYYLTNRLMIADLTNAAGVFNPGYVARLAGQGGVNPEVTDYTLISDILALPNGTALVEFSTLSNRLYYIQYRDTADTNAPWKTALPAVPGNGSQVQWIDSGPPKTESLPVTRFYRFVLLPQE